MDQSAETGQIAGSGGAGHGAGAQEEQALEDGMIEDVQQGGSEGECRDSRHSAVAEGHGQSEAGYHDANIFDGRIGEQPFDVLLDNREEHADHGGDAADGHHADSLSFPLIVKPSNEDASIGIDAGAVVHDLKELMERISFVQTEFGAPALVEEFIDGRELYVGVLEGERPEPLPILEWDFSRLPKGTPRIASSEAKWENDNPVYRNAPEIFPDDLPDEVVKAIGDTAVEAFKLLKLRDYGRIDMRLRRLNEDSRKQKKKPKRKANNGNGGHESELQDWEFHVIEVNPNPHLASNGELSLAARQKGMTYPDLIEGILGRALARPAR